MAPHPVVAGRRTVRICAIFSAILFVARVESAVLVVSPSGSSNKICSTAYPCDFATALRIMTPGDNITALAGVYETHVNITVSGTTTARLTINGGGGAAQLPSVTFVKAGFITLDGFSVLNATGTAITMRESPHVTIANTVLLDAGNYGVTCGGYGPGTLVACDFLELRNVTIGRSKNHGLYVGGPNNGLVLANSR